MTNVINKNKVLAVEGKDEVNFFKALLEHIEVTGFQVFDVAGKAQFKKKLPALVKMSGFSDVKLLAVIRDADDDANAAFGSIKYILSTQNLKPPAKKNQFSDGNPRIGIFIMPGDSDVGMLEDLCLKTVKDHPAMECVNNFSDCVSGLQNPPKIIAKTRAQTFLAAMPEMVDSVGIGAKKGYWDFNSNELFDLIKFLNYLK